MTRPVSLFALRTFVEVARSGSMRSAALSLGVTPGAVSQQIRLVEERLSTPLFHRSNRDVRLTEQGHRLSAAINDPFREIEEPVADFHLPGPRNKCLIITTVPSFAACWLVPRLGRFNALHPEIEIRIETSVELVDLRRGAADVAIRHGFGGYPGLDVTRLMTPSLVAVCSPGLAQGSDPIEHARDCLNFTLLQDRNRSDWKTWFKAQGVDDPDNLARRGPSFADDALLIEAASEGQGIAVVRDIYAERSLTQGRVVAVTDRRLTANQSYFFVSTPERAKVPSVRAFRNWVLQEMSSSNCIHAGSMPEETTISVRGNSRRAAVQTL